MKGGWPGLLILRALPTQWVPRPFAFFAKGRESEMPAPRGFDHVSTTKSRAVAIPAPGQLPLQLSPLYAPLNAHRDAAPGLASANS